jgi:hypothetical protein
MTLGPACYVPRADVLRGLLGPYLSALAALPRQWADVRVDGADVVADRLLRLTADGKDSNLVENLA